MQDITIISSVSFPDAAKLPLLADVQYHEPYLSAALNRKFRGIVDPGFYSGFMPKPGSGMNLLVTSSDNVDHLGVASVNIEPFYQITVLQQKDVVVTLSPGKRYAIILKGVYSINDDTHQVNDASAKQAALIFSREYSNNYDLFDGELLVCIVDIPDDALSITEDMIDISMRINKKIGITLSDEINSARSDVAASSKAVQRIFQMLSNQDDIQDATTTQKGIVQLSSDTDSESETEAATPKAVKAAYDLADGKYTAQDATTTQKGIVQLSSATDSESETEAATPKAVKAAYDLADGKYTAQDATTTQKGIVQLSSDTDSDSETEAATPKAIKAIKTDLDKKQPLNDMLTALSKLMPAGNAFPYFDADKKINLASISEIARQFISLGTLYSMQEFLVTPDLIARRIRSHSATFEPDVGNVFLAAYMRPADDFTMTARGRMVDGRYLRDINIELKPDMKTLIFNVDDIGTSSFPGSYAALYGYIGAITGYEIGLFIRFA
ncbi:tail fiber protein [Escherichia coli]|nr:tail fiber protein [Escherichia coli]MCO4915912.1 tail fiber protein [Escherichia coli]